MRQLSVLMVEDDPQMRDLLRSMLEQLGVEEIAEAGDGNTGIQKFLEKTYDIIMLDIGLPDMDGLKLLGSFKRLNRSAFVVLVTGDDSIESIQQAISAGANGYVVKPYSRDKIMDVINNYMLTNRSDEDVIDPLHRDHSLPE